MRWLPLPGTTVLIALAWCALAGSLSVNSLVFGLFIGVVIPLVIRPFRSGTLVVRSWPKAAIYVAIVLWDIIQSNLTVARIVLFKRNRDLQPAWVRVPLDLTNPEAIMVLAATITMTPGTLTADLTSDSSALLVHCLHAPDPDEVRDEIKARYEARLMEFME